MKARLVLLLLLGLAAPAASTPLAHREVLVNGIVLLVAERPAVPIVAVRVLVEAGAGYHPPHPAGLPNLTGAVLTRGTARGHAPQPDSAVWVLRRGPRAGAGRR